MVPTRAVDRMLGRIHVGTPDAEVEATMLRQIEVAIGFGAEADAWTPKIQRQTVRYAVWQHHRNQAMYARVMGGRR
jgi:hypothetical protein